LLADHGKGSIFALALPYWGTNMKSRVGSRGFWSAITVILLFLLFWGAVSLLGLKQRRDKEAVREYITRVRPILAADSRFKDVRLMGYSCDSVWSPYIPIDGTVPSQNDWNALNNIIQTSKPPVSIWVPSVRVVPDHALPNAL
jgi:hypothetical protein